MPSRRIPHRLTRSESSGPRPMRFRSGARRPTGSRPRSGTRGVVTSPTSNEAVARPAARGTPGTAAAAATPMDRPTEVSSAEETTTPRPHLRATRRAERTPPRGLGAADGFVGGDGHVHAATYLGQLVDGQAGLLDVFDGDDAGGVRHRGNGGARVVNFPGSVGVEADHSLPADGFTQRVGDGGDARAVARHAHAGFGDLDFRGRAAAGRLDTLVGLFGRDDGDRHVDGYVLTTRHGRETACGFEGGTQPTRRFGVVVVPEGGGFAPPGMTMEEEPLAASHSAEARGHRYLVHENVVDAFEGVARLAAHRTHGDAHERGIRRCINRTTPYISVILSPMMPPKLNRFTVAVVRHFALTI